MPAAPSLSLQPPPSRSTPALAAALLALLCLAAITLLAPATASAQSPSIAFTNLRGDAAHVYAVNADGSGLRALTRTPGAAFEGSPSYSPDGRRIAYTCGNFELCLMNSDGSAPTRLTTNDWPREFRYDTSPAWSPDGARIAFVRTVAGKDGIWIVNADGSGLRQVPVPAGVNASPSFSPDGSMLVFAHAEDQTDGDDLPSSSDSGIYVIRTDGGEPRSLTGPGMDAASPAWSPDGRHIAFVRNLDESPAQIHVMNVDGSERRRLTKRSMAAIDPSWSPDSTRIVFASLGERRVSLFGIAAAGGEPVRLTTGRGIHVAPSWQPNFAGTSTAPIAAPTVPPSAATADARIVGLLLRTLVSAAPAIGGMQSERAGDLLRAAERMDRLARRTRAQARSLRPTSRPGRRVRTLVLQSARVMRGVAGETRRWSRSVRRHDRRAARKHRQDALLGMGFGVFFTLAEAADVAGVSQAGP